MTRSGLVHTDLEAWERWAASRHRVTGQLRALKARVRPSPEPQATLYLPVDEPEVLVVVDKTTPSCRFAVVDPLAHLDPRRTTVLVPAGEEVVPEDAGWTATPWHSTDQIPGGVTEVLTLGSYLWLAGQAAQWARRRGVRHSVVQHGLLTPWAPPPAPGDHLLAWTEEDADFWASGVPGTAEVVGSQMLWRAASRPSAELRDERPLVLGQLHGVELPRTDLLHTYLSLCRGRDVDYRPHPNESDAVSRACHRLMRRAGITFDTAPGSVVELGRPVISIFSTGTLEAAQRGLPAWVDHPRPPSWVRDFWARYRLHRWGDDPTPAWGTPSVEPAAAVAAAVRQG